MTINQLFSQKPNEVIISKILGCFGLKNLEDNKIFTRKDLKEAQVLENLEKIKEDISVFYLPCKRKIYLENLNFKKSITVLRQFIKCYDYSCFSKEKYIQGEKMIEYHLFCTFKKEETNKEDKCIISFD